MNRRALGCIVLVLVIATSTPAASRVATSYPNYQAVLGTVEGFAILGNLRGCPPSDAKTDRITMAISYRENPPLTPTEIQEITDYQAWAAKTPNPQKANDVKFYNLQVLQRKLYEFKNHRMKSVFTLLIKPLPILTNGDLRAIQLEKWEAVIEMSCPFGNGMPGPCPNSLVKTITSEDFTGMPHPWDVQWRFRTFRASYTGSVSTFTSPEKGTLTLEFSPYFASGTLWSDIYGKRSIVANYSQAGLIGQQNSLKKPDPPVWLPLLQDYDKGIWKGYPSLVAQSDFRYMISEPAKPVPPALPLLSRPECHGK